MAASVGAGVLLPSPICRRVTTNIRRTGECRAWQGSALATFRALVSFPVRLGGTSTSTETYPVDGKQHVCWSAFNLRWSNHCWISTRNFRYACYESFTRGNDARGDADVGVTDLVASVDARVDAAYKSPARKPSAYQSEALRHAVVVVGGGCATHPIGCRGCHR